MPYGLDDIEEVDIGRVFLDFENSRHDPVEDQQNAIDYLCEREQLYEMAKDIVENGINPLTVFALILAEGSGTYIAVEGNRRLCALMLLNDPDLVPKIFRVRFRKIAKNWTPLENILGVKFDGRDALGVWLDRIHGGALGGRGLRSWDAAQIARKSRFSKNDLALAVLDVGEELWFISAQSRHRRISTVQKYMGHA